MFLRNVGFLSTDYTALYPRSQNSSDNLLYPFRESNPGATPTELLVTSHEQVTNKSAVTF
jgi:hypothetical protein